MFGKRDLFPKGVGKYYEIQDVLLPNTENTRQSED